MKVSSYFRKPLFKWIVAAIVFLIAVYGIAGFFVVPGIIGDKAQQFVSGKFQRKLEFEKISLNPFTLTATFDGMRLTEPGCEDDFASFDSLMVDLSSQSLFRMAPVIEEIRLVNPRVRLVRTARNHYNVDDFIAFAAEPKEDDSPARFSINNIQVENAVIEFDDFPQNKHHVVDELNVSIPFVSTIPSQVDIFVDLAINGRFNQEKIELTGKARPFFKDKDGTVNIRLDKINLPAYAGYLPVKPDFDLKDGKLSIDMEVGFGQRAEGQQGLTLEGNVVLESLLLAEPDGKPVLKIPEMTVRIAHSDVLSGKFDIGQVLLKGPEVYLDRSRAGQWNVERVARFRPADNTQKNHAGATADASAGKKDSRPFSVSLGKLSVENGELRVSDQIHVVPADFSVRNFALDVDGIVLDVTEKNVTVDRMVSAGTEVRFVHGKLKFQENGKPTRKTVQKAANEIGERTGFGFRVGRFELNDWAVHFENHDAGKPVVTKVDGLTVALDNLSSDDKEPVQLSVKANVNQKGTIAIGGSMNLSPFGTDLDLDIRDVDVRFVQPYIEDFVNLSLKQAELTVKGKFHLAQAKTGMKGQFAGDAGISRLTTVDQLSRQPFVSWKVLSLKGIRADLAPLSVVVDQVRLNDLMARVILSSQGRLNLQDILRSESGGRKSLTESEEKNMVLNAGSSVSSRIPENEGVAKKKGRPDYSIQIKKWWIGNGKIRFSDNFIKPRYTANLVDLRGTVSGLTTNPDKQAVVDVKGRVNGAPLVIAGSVNPLSERLSLDIRANVKGMELAQFSAYSGKYIGYGIDKGKLSFDVAYKVENDQLSAENALVLDQLTLGEKVDSESAVNLPVQLALSLLKDRNGVIDINLPIGGSLNDPEFSVGGIIFKVFVNLIQKAVTAPFSLLASIVGDTEELSWVAFDPGSYTLSESGQRKLETLARALEDRPGLRLEIAGKADPDADSTGLGKKMMMKKIRKMKARRSGQDIGSQQVTVSDEEYPDLLKRLYGGEDFDKPKNWIGFSKSMPVADMEKLLSQHFAGKKDDLIRLANRRAQAVKDWLIEKGNISEERLFLLAGGLRKTEGTESGNRVDFSLK